MEKYKKDLSYRGVVLENIPTGYISCAFPLKNELKQKDQRWTNPLIMTVFDLIG